MSGFKKTSKQRKGARQQRGVALITVLLVFALATVLAAELISRNYRDIRRTANAINSKQAYHYAMAGEQLARQILHRDFINSGTNNTDSLVEPWAKKLDSFEIENGKMSIEIIDQQGRFNLNNLGNNDNSASYALVFRELLKVLDLKSDYTAQLQDWLDNDSAILVGGAEDDIYLTQRNAYLSANSPIADRTELRLLNGMNFEDYNRLKDYVAVLPPDTKYNINTLDVKIVEALSSRISATQAANIKTQQLAGGHDSVAKWLSYEANLGSISSKLAVHSEYFEVIVKTVYDGRISVLRTQLFRDASSGEIQVLKRQQGFE
ncbi:MAG: type II secretion system minor pseudopilin GspK [Spongiibacteraceae bacterium]|nr:type II secretion system minor pseudopilin GspK [Spongiibacteraceae bacterium]